jgi:uncharacterized lipoprotein YmbA
VKRLSLLLLLAGCGRSPEVKYYALPTVGEQAADGSGPAVIVGPVRVPRLLDRAQLVHRAGASRLEVDDLHRWGATLDAEIARAVAENLARLLPSDRVVVHPAEDPGRDALRVALDVERLDAVPGGETSLRCRWIVRRDGEVVAVDALTAAAPLRSDDPDAIVAAYGAVVETLSRAVADRIRALPPTVTSSAGSPAPSPPPR